MGKTQRQMAQLGDNVTQQNISDALRKLELSRKKRLTDTENAMSSSAKLQERLKTKSAAQYVDEAGIDNREEYPYGYRKLANAYALKSEKT